MNSELFVENCTAIIDNCAKVIKGKNAEIKFVLLCFLCSGHVLLEDLPGTGKTMLLRAFAKTIGKEFKRVQFTPDLLPSDITGIHFYNQKEGTFTFRPGPLFADLVLADEINRATPRTQSSLLEAMEERQITIDGETHALGDLFFVMATQNPVESYGTFPLPEAQLDRFFMQLSLGYMPRAEELSVLAGKKASDRIADLEPVLDLDTIRLMKSHVLEVKVSDEVAGYLMDIVEKTRSNDRFLAGVSTRGAIALYHGAQAAAAMDGRDYVIPEDIKALAPHVLCHRIIGRGMPGRADILTAFHKLLAEVTVPLETVL